MHQDAPRKPIFAFWDVFLSSEAFYLSANENAPKWAYLKTYWFRLFENGLFSVYGGF
jgi:hypothetical protein